MSAGRHKTGNVISPAVSSSSNTAAASGSTSRNTTPANRYKSNNVSIAVGSKTYDAQSKGKLKTKWKNERKEIGRTVYVMRHGEALDAAFGIWIPECFDSNGNYTRQDMNMPKTLPKRRNSPAAWQQDPPLSEIGLHEAHLIGEGLQESNVTIAAVYSSPFYSCIQTCTQLLESLKPSVKPQIRVEPGFFELLGWHQDGIPELLSNDELIEAGHEVDVSYQPFLTVRDLREKHLESTTDCYERNYGTLKKILDSSKGNIMVVGHDTTLETCTRRLLGKAPRDLKSLWQVLGKIPNCSLAVMKEVETGNWRLLPTGRFSLSISQRPGFDCTVLEAVGEDEETVATTST